jgi:hypothetical protein
LLPAVCVEFGGNLCVTLDVPRKLLAPEFEVTLGRIGETATFVPVPETAMYVDSGSVLWQNDIRFPGYILAIETKPITEMMQYRANEDLGSSVLPANAGHIPAAPLWR